MNFDFTEEQLALESTLQRFLERDYNFEQRRNSLQDTKGYNQAHWTTFAELGLLALPFSSDYDGLDGGPVDTYLVMRNLGLGLVVEPYISTVVLCGQLVQALGNEEQKSVILGSIASGEQTLAFAHYEPHARHNEASIRCHAASDGDGWVLDGHKSAVLAASSAKHLLVSARHEGANDAEDGISVFIVPRDAQGITLKGWTNHDGTQSADVLLDNVRVGPEQLIGQKGGALPAIRWALAHANAALAAEASGIMRALLDATLEYLKTRKQFGVALSTFQALQHRLADMTVATELAESMALLAAITLQDTDQTRGIRQASGSKAFVAEKARIVGQEAIQLHGGIGVTDELDVAHYFKRLTTINMLFGDTDYHLRRYTETLEVEPAQ